MKPALFTNTTADETIYNQDYVRFWPGSRVIFLFSFNVQVK